jgi:hypothetical protein
MRKNLDGVRHWPYATKLAALALAAALAGCSDESSPVTAPEPGPAPRPEPGQNDLGVTPVVRRVDLAFAVNGAFRPGVPISITGIARARRQADQLNLELVVHDEPAAASTPGERAGWRGLASFQGSLGRGYEHRLTQTVTFAAPGYYRVSARAISGGPTPELRMGDSLIVNESYETLYILVDENGGRLTNGFEQAALQGRVAMFGSYGPFVAGARRPGARLSMTPGGEPARQTSTSYTFYFEYDNQDTGTKRPVPGAEVKIDCLDTGFNVYSTLYPFINSDGSFTFTCPYGYFDGNIRLVDIYSEVMGEGRAVAGVGYFNEGTARRLVAANQYAAHVFVTLRQYVPTAETRFGNRWRARLPVLVSTTNTSFGPAYYPSHDTVRTNYSRVFGQDGRFVTMHEYGHAYQYVAIEKWASSTCPSPHYTHLPSSRSCAYVEGFATFFAVWMAGNELTTGTNTDYGIETQAFYTNGDGLLIEGSFAGFLYDLVDGSGQRDNSANNAAFEETWDTAVYPGSFIFEIMQTCAPYVQSGTTYTYTYYLDGADQIVYCMENNVSAETYATTWSTNWRTTWTGVTHSATLPSGYSTSLVRTLWKRNLYGAI